MIAREKSNPSSDKHMTLRPRLSEKTFAQSEARVYVFKVPGGANKLSVGRAVEAQFGVTVEKINILTVKGKTKRSIRRGGRAISGQRSDFKKAYVTLKEGDKLPFFATEEDDKKDKKAKKAAKKGEEK